MNWPRPLASLLVALLPTVLPGQSAEEESAKLFRTIQWTDGPAGGRLGDQAALQIPKNCRLTDASGARAFMLATQNPPSGNETGVLFCRDGEESDPWFVVFSFDPSGYVRDDDSHQLDADKLLSTLRKGTERGNEERRKRGWTALTIDGWVTPPFYDSKSNNLTWSLRVHSAGETPTVNHSVRLLGRGGVMHADLVVDNEQLAGAVTQFNAILQDYSFTPGHRYSEWRKGDKMATYGLTALIAGGAGAAAVKLGLFGKLWKLIATFFVAAWKLIAVAVAATLAKIRSLFTTKKSTPSGSGTSA